MTDPSTCNDETGRVLWVGTTVDLGLASARYRMIHPATMLAKMGWQCDLTDRPERFLSRIRTYTAVVIVKRLDPAMIQLVSEANDVGVPVLLDLCDDVLDQDYRAHQHEAFRMVFDAISPRLAGLVTTGTFLQRRFAEYGYLGRISVIPDCVESEGLLAMSRRFLASKAKSRDGQNTNASGTLRSRATVLAGRARRLASAIRRPRRSALNVRATLHTIWHGPAEDRAPHPQASLTEPDFVAASQERHRTVIWFGNHGGPHSDFGMATLLSVAKELRAAFQRSRFALIVVSNDKDKWKHLIEPIGLPTRYVAWSAAGTSQLLTRARAFIMPRGSDSFSLSKSANRVTLALQSGTPVVSEHIESLDWMKDEVCSTGELADALVKCLDDRPTALAVTQELNTRAHEIFGIQKIAESWAEIFRSARPYAKTRGTYGTTVLQEKLLVLINNATDRPLAIAMIDSAAARGIETAAIVSAEATARNPRLVEDLIERRISPTFIQRSDTKRQDFRWLRNASALFCPSESSLPAHAVAHWLTSLANSVGVQTYTAQHGLANVGLTDRSAGEVTFGSRTIFTWRHPDHLPDWVEPSVRTRCVETGRIGPKAANVDASEPRHNPPRFVGIYENLHWKVYPQEFRDTFVDAVRHLANSHPDTTFSLIPHPAGLWSAKFVKGGSMPLNVEVRNPALPQMLDRTGVAVLPDFERILTTPSSIAVDASLAGVPVIIFAPAGFDLDLYDGLPAVQTVAEADDYLFNRSEAWVSDGTRAFLSRTVSPVDDPAGRALDIMFGNVSSSAKAVSSAA